MESANDPCKFLSTLDLSNLEDQKKIIFRDKHTRIEGLCSEAVFAADLLTDSFAEFSSGWWFKPANGRYKILKLITDLKKITPLDIKLFDFFEKHCGVFLILFKTDDKQCEWVRYSSNKMENRLAESWVQNAKPLVKNFLLPSLPPKQQRQVGRLNQAVEFLQARDRLQHAALERAFVNCWLGNQTIFDVDFFVERDGRIYAFEIKQKFPFRSGSRFFFGLNKGEAHLHVFLSKIGARCVHVILTKPVLTEAVPSIDLYTKDKYRDLSLWIATEHSEAITQSQQRLAPSKTSIYAKTPMRYYEMPLSNFHLVKKFGEQKPQALLDFIDGKTSPLPENFLYPHH
jgi:hypothetical protein